MILKEELKYSKSHEWIALDGDTAVVGLTDYAQSELGDLVFVNLPEVGDTVEAGEVFGDVESVKAVSDVYSPVTGEVTEINEELLDSPELINDDAYEAWFIKVKDVSATEELKHLWKASRNKPKSLKKAVKKRWEAMYRIR